MSTEDAFHKTEYCFCFEKSLNNFIRYTASRIELIHEGFNQIFHSFFVYFLKAFPDFQLRVHVHIFDVSKSNTNVVSNWSRNAKAIKSCQHISRVIRSFTKLLTNTGQFTGVQIK